MGRSASKKNLKAANVNMEDMLTVWENIKKNYSSLYTAEAKVADFILNNSTQALEANVSETAELSGVSDATVIRFCKRLGYTGFYQMKLQLSHDMGRNTVLQQRKEEGEQESAHDRIMAIAGNIMTISRHINTDVMKGCAAAIDNSETVYVIGNGYAKIIACDIMYRLIRLGVRCSGGGYSETDFENIYLGREGDVAIFISRSGEDKKTYKEMQLAKKKGMITVSLTDAVKCPMAQLADYKLTTGIEDRAKVFIHTNSSSLNMMVLVEILLGYVTERHKNHTYLDEVIAEDRL